MEYIEYIQHVSFRFYHPMVYPKGFTRLSQLLRLFKLSFEMLNTRLPEHEKQMRHRLAELLSIPRMSTFAIGAILNEGVARLPGDECFVNIGVWNGFTLFAGMKDNSDKHCIGVDNFSEFDGPKAQFLKRFTHYKSSRHTFYEMDYKKYFATVHREKIGLYLYDGDHSYEEQLRGLQIAEPFFSKQCVVFIDDTNQEAPRQATLDFIHNSAAQYRIVLDQLTCIADHPTFWDGLMILQRCE